MALEDANKNGNGAGAGEGEASLEEVIDTIAGDQGGAGEEEGQPGAGDGEGEGQPAPEQTGTLTPEEAQALRTEVAELRSWREEQTRARAEEQKGKEQPTEPRVLTKEDWAEYEKSAGFMRSKTVDAEGKEVETLAIDPQKNLQFMIGMVQHLGQTLREEFGNQLHEKTSGNLLDGVFSDLEKRPGAPVPDIRQYSTAIKEHLRKWHKPQDWTNPEVVLNAYFVSKGRGARDMAKKIENNKQTHKRVIHPTAGGGSTQQKPTAGAAPVKVGADVQEFLEKLG